MQKAEVCGDRLWCDSKSRPVESYFLKLPAQVKKIQSLLTTVLLSGSVQGGTL